MSFLRQLSRSALIACTCSPAFSHAAVASTSRAVTSPVHALTSHSFFSTSSSVSLNNQRGWDKRGSASSSARQRPPLRRSRKARPEADTISRGTQSTLATTHNSRQASSDGHPLRASNDESSEGRRRLPPDAPRWRVQKEALRDKFPVGWAPPKKLSREAMDLIRVLVDEQPDVYTTPVLAERFKISPEAIRRIIRSRFVLSASEREKREARRRELRARQVRDAAEGAEGGEKGRVWAGDWVAEQEEMRRLGETSDDGEPRRRRQD